MSLDDAPNIRLSCVGLRLASSGPRLAQRVVMSRSSVQRRSIREASTVPERRPESAVSIAEEGLGLHDEAHRAHLANVPEGRHVGAPAVYAVIGRLGHGHLR